MGLFSLWQFNFLHILTPLILANVLHMLVVRKNWFSRLALPISSRSFGGNKTWRGIILIILLSEVFFILTFLIIPFELHSFNLPLGYGMLLGLAYALAELPNSWFKRRMGIAPGKQAIKYKWIFSFLDKSDSSLAVAILVGIMISESYLSSSMPTTAVLPNFSTGFIILMLFLQNILTHILFSAVLVGIGIKRSF